ncbi:rhamnulose-1-phosphate aldolase [Virgibacillus pantothenticus]|uniref:rhamnulose-1-phosphate aldolase n=1 Tax=Virgibacillus pantothenticus TaxID=1473 RepID=UPI001B007073|nr:rhamnulose-1-phosphate aldolase [Virgibacillus pantothenticus]MBU8568254.1 rhamnulose-1-phosphate aldolase [Virgibacillus pantothenticus]MBU8602284.1 rhamnulose-1-phosphate aldolase [Virgibacillus pantothenticus]MBU8636418.1 rhamnulose-1-phosphate aldolase [Virgibacillus pantothenticus]MBU8644166.1 rhamnulose-1-phosphate aldolase [Virgibacillus pantothenticus]MBU8648347.1 rhamnulose-1-phosphate aldolase [Virgibacillus pantothenticus]
MKEVNGNKQAILDAPFVREMIQNTYDMWRLGWDELNGGNISYLLNEEEVTPYLNKDQVIRTIQLDYPVTELAGKYFIVTGSGKYFRFIKDDPEESLGILRISSDGKVVELLWGLEGNSQPTSELPSHFMSHISRLKQNPDHRVIMHTHTTNLIAMTFTHELDEVNFTRTLWKMCTECLVVFPEGVGILPWMVPGTDIIGEETAKKMKEFRLVIWPHHGIFGAGKSLAEAFGLIETVEKAAQIYMLVSSHQGGIKQDITDEQLRDLAKRFAVTPPEKYFL